MSNDAFKSMCAELVDSVELLLEMRAVDAKPMAITEDRVSRARALLAQPVAKGPRPIPQGELDAIAERHGFDSNLNRERAIGCMYEALRRFGRPTPQPVAVSERLPEPEDCIKRGNDHWCWGQERSLLTGQVSARWRLMRVSALTDEAVNWLPANALPTPEAND